MRKHAYALALVAAASLFGVGCSDVGDSSVAPGDDAQSPADGSLPESGTGTDGTVTAEAGPDVTVPPDSEAAEAAPDVTTPVDANVQDAADAMSNDGSVADAPADDGGDAGQPDAGEPDTGADASQPDAGTDAGSDAGESDAGHDGSVPDAGGDAGSDGGSALVPCTTAGQPNCVQCDNSVGNLCTPTEAAIVARDIAKGYVTAAGPEPATACYECLAQASQLDDTTGDTGNECGDTTNAAECLTTLNCLLASECAATAVNVCYCGTAPVSSSCNAVGAGNAANGVCKTQIAAGLGFTVDDGHDILANLIGKHYPSGIADRILQSAITNSCTTCLQ